VTSPSLVSGRYEIERVLGHGGMATVVLARDAHLGRRVAVKQLDESLADSDEVRIRFVREAQLAARLNHPNIVGVFDAGEDAGRPYIVMEYVDGDTLAAILKRRRRLDPHEAVALAAQAAVALQHAHEAGLIHRDVKPGNLLVRDDGTLKVTDFGIARAAEATQVTERGTILGTAAYLAPEQARGEPATPAADVYALGAVLYEMLTGRPPYRFESLADLSRQQQRGAVEPTGISPELDAVLLRALAADPAERPASAAVFAEQLRTAIVAPAIDGAEARTVVIPRRPVRERPRRSRTWTWIAVAVLAAAAAGLALAVAADDAGDGGEARPPATTVAPVTPVPRSDDPQEQARLLSEWLRANSR
jgi:serine/threonine protein kinase